MLDRPVGFLRNEQASVTATAHATSHTEGNYAEVIAATSRPSYAIAISLNGTQTNTTATSCRVDIATGAAASETVIIADLLAGYSGATLGEGATYYFPIYIPSGTRIAARAQALISGDTVDVFVNLLQDPVRPVWYGTRVTSYGAGSNSLGTAITAGTTGTYASPTYGTGFQLDASTGGAIKLFQIGLQGNASTALTGVNGLASIRATTTVLIEGLPFGTSSTERVSNVAANNILARTAFNLPAGIDLRVATWASGAETTDMMLYGVR